MADEVEVLLAVVEVSVVAVGVAVAAFVADSLHGKHWQTKPNKTKWNGTRRTETEQNERKQNNMEKKKRVHRLDQNDYRLLDPSVVSMLRWSSSSRPRVAHVFPSSTERQTSGSPHEDASLALRALFPLWLNAGCSRRDHRLSALIPLKCPCVSFWFLVNYVSVIR